jgi:hypothetical protein
MRNKEKPDYPRISASFLPAGVSYNTAWKIHHKLAQVMLEREQAKPLEGRVEADDAYLGGEHGGGKRGRGAPGKMPIIAAVETTKAGKPVRIKTPRVKAFSKIRSSVACQSLSCRSCNWCHEAQDRFRSLVERTLVSPHQSAPRCFKWVD